GVVTKVVDPYGGAKTRERDSQGRMAREIDSGGREVRWVYDAEGMHWARVDRFGNVFPPELQMPVIPNVFARKLPCTSLDFVFAGKIARSNEAAFGIDPGRLAGIPHAFAHEAALCLRVRSPQSHGASPTYAAPQVKHDALGRKIQETDVLGRS